MILNTFQKNWPQVQTAVFRYLGVLFNIGKEIFDHGQISVKKDPIDTVSKVHELFNEESAIPSILHLTLVALLSAPIEISYEVSFFDQLKCKSVVLNLFGKLPFLMYLKT